MYFKDKKYYAQKIKESTLVAFSGAATTALLLLICVLFA